MSGERMRDSAPSAAPVSLAAAASGVQSVFMLVGGWTTGHLDEGWRSAAAMLILVAQALYLWLASRPCRCKPLPASKPVRRPAPRVDTDSKK